MINNYPQYTGGNFRLKNKICNDFKQQKTRKQFFAGGFDYPKLIDRIYPDTM